MLQGQNITKKYNLKMKYNQHGQHVDEDFFDVGEILLIEYFEKIILELKKNTVENYVMIELGSNQAYYSLLFKSILREKNVTSIMVEPYSPYLERGIEHFEINNFDGIFINKSIGNNWVAHNTNFDCETITVDDIMDDYQIDQLLVLHSDIDGSEIEMLKGCKNSLTNKKIKYGFILTHGIEKHMECLNIISNYDYDVLLDYREDNIGHDSLIIIKSR